MKVAAGDVVPLLAKNASFAPARSVSAIRRRDLQLAQEAAADRVAPFDGARTRGRGGDGGGADVDVAAELQRARARSGSDCASKPKLWRVIVAPYSSPAPPTPAVSSSPSHGSDEEAELHVGDEARAHACRCARTSSSRRRA